MQSRIISYAEFGEPGVLSLSTVNVGQPGEGQVQVKMAGAGLNPIDYKTRRGLGFAAEKIKTNLPWTPGYDLSGEIVSVGKGVSQFSLGDAVYGMIGFPSTGGAYAEYVNVDAETLCPAPKSIPLAHAAAIPLAALTAWKGLFVVGRLQPGSTVLVHAGAGGVGHFAVQFAVAKGCEVIATASERNHKFLESLGVSRCIDYKQQNVFDVCPEVDFVLDNAGGETGIGSLGLLAKGGKLVTVPTVTASQIIEKAHSQGLDAAGLTVDPSISALSEITHWIDNGDLQVNIAEAFPMENAVEAHIELEKGHTRGKLILIP